MDNFREDERGERAMSGLAHHGYAFVSEKIGKSPLVFMLFSPFCGIIA